MIIKTDLKAIKEVFRLTGDNVGIVALKEGIRLTALTKEGITVEANVTGEVIKEGSLLLDKRIIENIKEKNSKIEIEENKLIVNKRTFKFDDKEPIYIKNGPGIKVMTLSLEDYNKILSLDYAVSKASSRESIQNVLIDEFNIVALDGHRLGIRKHNIKFNEEYTRVETLIPLNLFNLMKKIKPGEKSLIEIYKDNQRLILKVDNMSFSTYEYQGSYIKYKGLLPTDNHIEVTFNSNEIQEILKSYKKDTKIIKLEIEQGEMKIKSEKDNFTIIDTVEVENNKSITIGFNPIYLKDSLKIHSGNITMTFRDCVSPGVIEKGDYYDLVLPLRTYN